MRKLFSTLSDPTVLLPTLESNKQTGLFVAPTDPSQLIPNRIQLDGGVPYTRPNAAPSMISLLISHRNQSDVGVP